ncbi:MAG: sigma-70 family RNA polymerase sigma factor [Bacteroidales bacterium]|nr:sigma-70 family RNA polymerase sigma factor [Bacteroidales bacterium]
MADNKNSEDRDLIEQVRAGNKAAFSRIVNKYEPVVASTVIGMLGRGDDAEDVGQNVFIRFYNAIGDFRGEASLSTYLTRIAINLSLNEIKKRKRRNVFFINRREEDPEIDYRFARDDAGAHDTAEVVNKALQQLEPKFRSVVVLRMLQGYTSDETAKILKLPLGTVLSRLSRAQDKLKEVLKVLID